MSVRLYMDDSAIDLIVETLKNAGKNAEDAINEVMHNEAGPIIYEKVNPLIHPSGRKFRGHTKSARVSNWPRYDTNENLTITVGTKSKWHYLYFPDDGSSTYNHAGNQQFFFRGGQAAIPEIVDRCLAAAIKDLE